jgi:hypothetical protein
MADPTGAQPGANPGLTLQDHLALAMAPRLRPEQQVWNLPAKIAAGRSIAEQERQAFLGHHNDLGDAMRHAEWSQRMAQQIGPVFSGLAGLQHEGVNMADAVGSLPQRLSYGAYNDAAHHPSVLQTLSESGMDLRNNAEGIAAAVGGRPIDPRNLQARPVLPGYR